jgi:O-antigen/teichoic acid export membrane protein
MNLLNGLKQFWQKNPLMGRIFFGAKWSIGGAILGRFLALVLSIAIARMLNTELFGQFLVVQSTLTMFGMFAGLGLGVVATKFAAELHQRDTERLGRILGLVRISVVVGSLAIASICALLAPVIAVDVFHRPELTIYIRIISAAVVFLTLDGYNTAALFGLEYIKQSVKGAILSTLISVPTAALLTWQFGLAGAVYGLLLTSALQCVVSHILLRGALKERGIFYLRHTRAEWSVLYQYAIPSLLGGIMVLPVHWLCQAMLASTPNGMAQVAVMGVGLQWFQLILFLPFALSRVVMPILTDVIATGDTKSSSDVLRVSTIAHAVIAAPAAIVVSVLSDIIMRLYDVQVPNAALALTLIVIASAVSAACTPIGQILVARGQMWYGVTMNILWAAVYLSLSWTFLSWGVLGISMALLASYLIHSISNTILAWKSFNSKFSNGKR